ncbi:hypothetical protein N658DRAFT_78371 [Parathielavia hyrcaniae]|uniref:Disintegrin and metalloproteinase domain-containing protein B n=1 Tax=Parathielavia hyrcaniae TaxID=113614 RepID=A0AAN6Q079_9PEZI|nr:hypothetical protein N658DRAFT_78371 [Parathielavia hyrcaniae]
MLLSKAFTAIVTTAGLLVQDATAHSVNRNPLSSIARIEDAVIQTPSHRVHAHSSFDVSFVLSNTLQKIRLALEPNHDLFGGDATIQYLAADGSVRRVQPIVRQEHRVFRGESFVQRLGEPGWEHAGWARINVRRDGDKPIFDGVFTMHGNHYHVQTKTTYRQTSVSGDPQVDDAEDEYMVVWRDSDIQPAGRDELKRDLGDAPTCGSDGLVYNRDENNVVYRSLVEETPRDTSAWQLSPRALFGRQTDIAGGNGAGVNLANSIGSTQGCPSTRKIALIGIATDCTYTRALGSEDAVTSNVVQMVNAASQLYESTFNISLAIQNMTISDGECPSSPPPSAPWNTPCSDSVNIERRLSLFSQWRGQWQDTNAYWTLLSTCSSGAAVGLAWLGAICQEGSTTRNNETSASANVVVRTSTEWLVFAHETGHTFGAVHDCVSTTCADGSVQKQECCPLSSGTCNAQSQFIMNPSTGDSITNFSPCSIGNICSFLGRSNRASCLISNRGVTTFTGSQCGNGIVEQGEDCDCGGEESCASNPCCDPATCKYTAGSVCDPTNEECCTGQCTFMGNGTVCRDSTGSCDPQEVCSGTSAGCPADLSAPDGQACGSGDGLACASGRCTSRDQQCRTFMSDVTGSCSSSGCQVSCHSARLPNNQCYITNQYFLDGTPCEGGGRCNNGNCVGTNLGQQILEWIQDNKQISIPIFCVVGGLLLLALISCLWSCCARRRRRSRSSPPKFPAAAGPTAYYGAHPVGGGGGGSGGGHGYSHGGAGAASPGPMMRPGPSYAPLHQEGVTGMPSGQQYEPMRSRSFRYA